MVDRVLDKFWMDNKASTVLNFTHSIAQQSSL